jgi:uncharacterized protein Yka (UPF0111/DUF47 family)
MSLLIFKIFKSQNKKTYNTFQKVSNSLDLCIENVFSLNKEIENNNPNRIVEEIIQTHRINKSNIHTLAYDLGGSYIIPYDREDIYEIVNSVNEISKLLVAFAKKRNQCVKYNIDGFDIGLLIEIVLRSVKEVSYSFKMLQKFKSNNKIFSPIIDKIQTSNIEFDSVFENLTNQNITLEEDMRSLILKQDVLEILNKLNIKTSNHVHILESIMVKYS